MNLPDGDPTPIRPNLKAIAAVICGLIVAAGAYFALRLSGEGRIRADALAEVQRLIDSGETARASEHLDQFLAMRPDDVDVLEIQGRLMADLARSPAALLEAAQMNDRLLRLAPEGPKSNDARRRLVDLYIRYSDSHRSSTVFLNVPEVAAHELRYRAAEVIARDLVRSAPGEASSHRLLAMALEGLAVPGDKAALHESIREFEAALARQPRDLVAAEHLAQLLEMRRSDPAGAKRVLDALLGALPGSSEARLVRFRHSERLRKHDQASVEIEEATRLAPQDLEVRLAAAELALKRSDPASAWTHLDQIPDARRQDLRVRMLRGMAELTDERDHEAIGEWRLGLIATRGTSADITWWLAYAMVRLGRVTEAEPLITQYFRLVGDEADPRLNFLQALSKQATGRPADAIEMLEKVGPKLGGPFQERVHLTIGRCYQALGDDAKALASYRKAAQSAPAGSPSAVLAMAGAMVDRNPSAAIAEIRRGLARSPDDPELRIALASTLLKIQSATPQARRNWTDFDHALAQAAQAAPRSATVALMKADRQSLDGRAEQSVPTLQQATAHDSRDARLWTALADGLEREGRRDEALAALEKASKPGAAGDQAILRAARARLLLGLGRGREAREVLGHDLEKLPPDQRHIALQALARLAVSQGDMAAAASAYDAWIKLRPDDPLALLGRLDLAITARDQASIDVVLEALKKAGGSADTSYLLARATVLLKTRSDAPDQAATLVDQVLAKTPGLPAAHLLRGRISEKMGRVEDAIASYQRAQAGGLPEAVDPLAVLLVRTGRRAELDSLRKQAGDTRVSGIAAHVSWQAGNVDAAVGYVSQAVRAPSEGGDTAPWEARSLAGLGRVDEAEAVLVARANREVKEKSAWLDLVRFQVQHGRIEAAKATVARAIPNVDVNKPELFAASCQFALGDWESADRAFAEAVRIRADDPEAQLAAARYFEETGRPDRSIRHLESALALQPANREAARQLAVQLAAGTEAGAWDRAWKLVAPEVPGATAPEDRLARAVILSRHPSPDRRAEAAPSLDALLADLPADHPSAVAARDYLARLLLADGHADRAARICAVSVEIDPNPINLALYAESLIRDKRFAEADEQLDQLALSSPTDPREPQLRARLIRDRAGQGKAAEALVGAVADLKSSPAAKALGREIFHILIDMKLPDNSTARVAGMMAERDPALGWMVAEAAARGGRPLDALDACLKTAAVARGDDLLRAAQIAMMVASSPGDERTLLDRSAAVLDAAIAREPRSESLRMMTALIRHQQARYDEEVALYRAILAGRPEGDRDADPIRNNLVWAVSEGQGRPEEALKMADDLVARHRNDPQYLTTRGALLIRLKKYDLAVADLQAAVKSQPSPQRQYHLARALRGGGHDDESRRSLDRAIGDGLSLKTADPTERTEMASVLNR
ncbi:MAG: Tetratricopeptide 1 repeat-containing protein [Planctomycetota bacterium]|nr:Tetratricopeptide 1 repeat-containing protein [Planctomycetota bacterium]